MSRDHITDAELGLYFNRAAEPEALNAIASHILECDQCALYAFEADPEADAGQIRAIMREVVDGRMRRRRRCLRN